MLCHQKTQKVQSKCFSRIYYFSMYTSLCASFHSCVVFNESPNDPLTYFKNNLQIKLVRTLEIGTKYDYLENTISYILTRQLFTTLEENVFKHLLSGFSTKHAWWGNRIYE